MKRAFIVLLVAGVACAAILYDLGRAPHNTRSGSIPELILLVPPDASYLLYADLTTLRSSRFLAQLLALAPAPAEDSEYAEFVRATGFDYARDLDRLAVAIWPASPTNSVVALGEGRFSREKISRYALRSGRQESRNGTEVYVVPADRPYKTIAFAFLAGNRVVLADGPSLESALDLRPPVGIAAPLRERIARVAGSAFFAVGQIGPQPEGFSFSGWRSDQINNLLRSLRWLTVAAQPEGEHMQVVVEGECDSSENARQLAGAVEGLRVVAGAALAAPRTRSQLPLQAAALLDAIVHNADVSRTDNRVQLHFELTAAMLATPPAVPAGNDKNVPK